jgi:hypothetical protein
MPPLHELSLYQDEPWRLRILATAIAIWYDELAQRSRSMRLEVDHLRFYTRLMSDSDSKAAKSYRHSSPDKSRRETKKEVLSGWRGRWGGSDGPMQLLHEPVPRLRWTFKVAYANNWHHSYIQRAHRKELNPCAKSWSIETLHKNNFWVRLESCRIREVEFARQK